MKGGGLLKLGRTVDHEFRGRQKCEFCGLEQEKIPEKNPLQKKPTGTASGSGNAGAGEHVVVPKFFRSIGGAVPANLYQRPF